ncbi:hypothetical protein MRB53_041332 [Persea americana]|nr:hypothetical protein MRB53_041332 [Persea americana]
MTAACALGGSGAAMTDSHFASESTMIIQAVAIAPPELVNRFARLLSRGMRGITLRRASATCRDHQWLEDQEPAILKRPVLCHGSTREPRSSDAWHNKRRMNESHWVIRLFGDLLRFALVVLL